ncbi:CDP-glycerol glycerophosphotransferase family protein [Arthrobacter sp. Marseille-P9274]|uniref:CDP-glycerol glycerophosphotransferase family protein n=1 Tax=Arthrobacter sp. Marseille-P9274 TaxID=2866572 RepID=UPI0021C87FB4|nr:CDP-glycerol glycerophosphotransferase family protein [Arthrobacter sp. Marseille-P9274]
MPRIEQFRRALKVLSDHASNLLLERRVRQQLASAAPATAQGYDAVIYFADDVASAYQVRQWFGPMSRLARTHPVAVLCHRPSTAAALLKDAPLPVYLATGITQVEDFVRTRGTRVVFYVNNNQANFTVLRLTSPIHIHLSHGESDKISMASNQLKAYDHCFIAGEASRRRIEAAVRHLRPGSLVEIGRPQLDDFVEGTDGDVLKGRTGTTRRATVLYAPTWEGDRPAMAYGSLVSHGPALVEAILASSEYRLVFRPHPRSGTRLAAHGQAVDRIAAMIRAAAKAQPDAGHYVDDRPDFAESFTEADVCICDISAMAMDWLPRGKPLLVTLPADAGAAVDRNGIAGVVPLLDAGDSGNIVQVLHDLEAAPVSQEQLDLVHRIFGDTAPYASTRRFISAFERALAEAGL